MSAFQAIFANSGQLPFDLVQIALTDHYL